MILSAAIHGWQILLPALESVNMYKATVEVVMSRTATSDDYTLGVWIVDRTGITKTSFFVIRKILHFTYIYLCTYVISCWREKPDSCTPLGLIKVVVLSTTPLPPTCCRPSRYRE